MMVTEGNTKMSPTPKMSFEAGRSEVLEQVLLGTQNAIYLSNSLDVESYSRVLKKAKGKIVEQWLEIIGTWRLKKGE